jgi:hypothetical protein
VDDPNLAKIIDSKALDDISFTRIDIIESRLQVSGVDYFVGTPVNLHWVQRQSSPGYATEGSSVVVNPLFDQALLGALPCTWV